MYFLLHFYAMFSTSTINCQHMLLLSLSLYCMCRLSQISMEDSYLRISSSVCSFVQTFLPTIFAVLLSTHALNYTSFPGLVQVAAESECGASLHGHRKCSEAGSPLVNCDLGESVLEGGYMWQSASLEKQRGTWWCLLSCVTLPLYVCFHQLLVGW
jgi:hypothetical protein